VRWKEALLLNIRGLSEIVFLNLLLQQGLISPSLYFALMLMSLIATLLPALLGMNRPLDSHDVDVVEHSKRKPCANS
jgi:hypothetical protein